MFIVIIFHNCSVLISSHNLVYKLICVHIVSVATWSIYSLPSVLGMFKQVTCSTEHCVLFLLVMQTATHLHPVSESSVCMCISQKTVSSLLTVRPYCVVALSSGQSIVQFLMACKWGKAYEILWVVTSGRQKVESRDSARPQLTCPQCTKTPLMLYKCSGLLLFDQRTRKGVVIFCGTSLPYVYLMSSWCYPMSPYVTRSFRPPPSILAHWKGIENGLDTRLSCCSCPPQIIMYHWQWRI